MRRKMLVASCHILWLLTVLSRTDGVRAQCRFQYLQQPPSTPISNCNPYSSTQSISIAVECLVRRVAGVVDAYEIRWFRENASGVVEPLGFGLPELGPARERTSRYHDNRFLHQPYNPSFLGKYWCQVINTTADPDQPLMRSNVFTLLAPGNYTGSTCAGAQVVQVIQNESCADLQDRGKPLLPTATNQFPTLAHSLSSQTPSSIHNEHSLTVTAVSHSTSILLTSTVEYAPAPSRTSMLSALPSTSPIPKHDSGKNSLIPAAPSHHDISVDYTTPLQPATKSSHISPVPTSPVISSATVPATRSALVPTPSLVGDGRPSSDVLYIVWPAIVAAVCIAATIAVVASLLVRNIKTTKCTDKKQEARDDGMELSEGGQAINSPPYWNPHYFKPLHHQGQFTSSTQSMEIVCVSPPKVLQDNKPHSFQGRSPPSPDHNEAQELSTNPADYQQLNTDTIDCASMYSTITTAGGRETPSVEVEGKLYSVVDPTRREEHAYTELHIENFHHSEVQEHINKPAQCQPLHTETDYDEVQEHSTNPAHNQPLNTDTRNHTSVHSTTIVTGRREDPSVEVEGKLYSILYPTRKEDHIYTTPQQ